MTDDSPLLACPSPLDAFPFLSSLSTPSSWPDQPGFPFSRCPEGSGPHQQQDCTGPHQLSEARSFLWVGWLLSQNPRRNLGSREGTRGGKTNKQINPHSLGVVATNARLGKILLIAPAATQGPKSRQGRDVVVPCSDIRLCV